MTGDQAPLRFLIAGAGAVGSGFGAMLRLAGHEVALLDPNREHMAAVGERGLRMKGLWGERTATGFRVLAGPDEIDEIDEVDEGSEVGEVDEVNRVDYVVVATKAFDTEHVLDDVVPRAPGAQFVTLQNGLGNLEAVAARAGPDRAIGGMVIIGFELAAPGEVAVTVYGGEVLLGRPGALERPTESPAPTGAGPGTSEGAPPGPDLARLVEAFAAAGIPTRATDNIAGAIWGKVLYNCALNALGAVLEVPYGELARTESWAVIGDVVCEAFAVARAEGVRLSWPDPEAYLQVLRSRQLPATAAHRSSMLQDLERGRRTEIDHLNGAVATLGAARGVPTPVNAELAALVRFLESRLPDAPR